MKIFYGVQGTGNGHITRSRIMAKELKKHDIEVDFLFSGRDKNSYFDMEEFGNYQTKNGITFNINNGKVNYLQSFKDADITQLLRDIDELDLSGYDLVISDYEPITSWAGKIQGKKVIGIGHQYAFNYNIPKKDFNPISSLVMKYFAPCNVPIGLHWNHFNQMIFPPIIDQLDIVDNTQSKILVYLPFEDLGAIVALLAPFDTHEFYIYHNDEIEIKYSHIKLNKLSKEGFKKDLLDCSGVICNAGFELISESLNLNKKILIKPLSGQAEQASNALAFELLDLGTVMNSLDVSILYSWLKDNKKCLIRFNNTAELLVNWIKNGCNEITIELIEKLWN